jgi:hypothetical protein
MVLLGLYIDSRLIRMNHAVLFPLAMRGLLRCN